MESSCVSLRGCNGLSTLTVSSAAGALLWCLLCDGGTTCTGGAALEQRFMKVRSSVRHRTTQAHLVGDIEASESFWASEVRAA